MFASTESGAGSVLGVAVIGAMIGGVMLVGPLAMVAVASASVSAAADAAALAAADVRVGREPGFPCTAASTVALANRVTMTVCRVDGFDATVSVEHRVLGFLVEATATAGPPR